MCVVPWEASSRAHCPRDCSGAATAGQQSLVVQAVHDRSWCMFEIKGFVPVREGLKRTLDWAREADVDARPQHHQFHAEIPEKGQGALTTVLGTGIEIVEAN